MSFKCNVQKRGLLFMHLSCATYAISFGTVGFIVQSGTYL